MNLFEFLVYSPIYLIIIFVFIFIFLNMFLDIRNHLKSKKGQFEKQIETKEGFISETMRSFDSNVFKQIILPNLDDYDLELAIPVNQKLNATVQGSWGFNTDEYRKGFSVGVYRDGYTADGAIFKGVDEKVYKYMLDQGPYVLRYENRINKDNKYDVRIFLNNKEIIYAKDQGVPSGKVKFIGTNETLMNKKTDSTSEGRRDIDYLKFIPKSNKKN